MLTLSPYEVKALVGDSGDDNLNEDSISLSFLQETPSVMGEFTTLETPVDTTSEINEQFLSSQDKYDTFYKKLGQDVERIRIHKQKVARLLAYLKRQKSPVATEHYADLIITISDKHGIDYKMIVAISGVESGFCRANYKVYNCFGYLNGVQYSSFDAAFQSMIPKIGAQYVKVYGTNFEALAKAYGMQNVSYQSGRLKMFYNGI